MPTDEQIRYWANAIYEDNKDRIVADMASELLAARAVVEAARGWYCECAREIATNEEGQQAERVTECIMCVAIRNYDEAVK